MTSHRRLNDPLILLNAPLILLAPLFFLLLGVALAHNLGPAVRARSLVVKPVLDAVQVEPVAAVEPAQPLTRFVRRGHADCTRGALRVLEPGYGADPLGRYGDAPAFHVAPW